MDEFVTQAGVTVPLKAPGRRFVDQILRKHDIPDPPQYKIETVGGGEQWFDHDETTLKTDEDEKDWAEYQEDRDQAIMERMAALSEFLVYTCVAVDPPPLGEWETDFELFDLDPPDPSDKKAYKVFWIENELCPAADDWAGLMSRLMSMAGLVGEDQIEAYEQFFRATLARLGLGR